MKRGFALLLCALLLLTAVPMASADIHYNDNQLNWGGMYDPTTPCPHRTRTQYEAVASTCVEAGHGTYAVCNDCGILLEGSDAALPLAEHVYDDRYDADCNVCGFIREVTIKGDADGDGQANNRDYGCLQQCINEWDVSINIHAVDLDGNDRLNNHDLGLLQRYLNGWEI